jgi:hypothetical protein
MRSFPGKCQIVALRDIAPEKAEAFKARGWLLDGGDWFDGDYFARYQMVR